MSFTSPKSKAVVSTPAVPAPQPRRKATVRFTETQWDQLHAYCFQKKTTVQAVVISALADKLERFDA